MQEQVFLVHGTGAASAEDVGDQWWQLGGLLDRALKHASAKALIVQPFHWSGANSELERRRAGRRLAREIRLLAAAGTRVHLVGHSHGGSVIWHALTALAPSNPEALRAVASVSSVGTPYLTFGVRRADLVLRMVLAALSVAFAIWMLAQLVGAHLRFALALDPWGASGWCVLALLACAAAAVASVGLARAASGVLREIRRRRAYPLLARLAGRFLALWSVQDEPTLGLVASGSLNHPVARWRALSELVNNVLARSLQGSDLPFLELRAASPHPIAALANRPLPEQVDTRLIEKANAATALLASAARGVLLAAGDSVSGLQTIKRLLPERMTYKELVHTTYFDDPACLELVLLHIGQQSIALASFAADASLHAWYRERLDTPQEPGARPLPSNRLWRYVAVTSGLAAGVAGLAAVAGQLLAERAIHPTSLRYWVVQLAADRAPMQATARGNYGDFSPVLRRLIEVGRKDKQTSVAMLREALHAWPGAVRMPPQRLDKLVAGLVETGLVGAAVDAGLFTRLDGADTDHLAEVLTRQRGVAQAIAEIVAERPKDEAVLVAKLLDACASAPACRTEALVAQVETLVLYRRHDEAKALLARNPGLDATYREGPGQWRLLLRRPPPSSARPSLADAAIWLAQNGMHLAAARLAADRLDACKLRPAGESDVELERAVMDLLKDADRRVEPERAKRLGAGDIRRAALELATCGRLTEASLAKVEVAAGGVQAGGRPVKLTDIAHAQARLGNCALILDRPAWRAPEILALLSSARLCADFAALAAAPPPALQPTQLLLERIDQAPLKAGAISAFSQLYEQQTDPAVRDTAISVFVARLHRECAKDPKSPTPPDKDATTAASNVPYYMHKKPLTPGRAIPAGVRAFADALFRDALPGCTFRGEGNVAGTLQFRTGVANGLIPWIAPVDAELASRLEQSVQGALKGFSHPDTHGASVTDLYPVAVDPLLRAGRHREALAWLQGTNMGEPLRYNKQVALLRVALCARDAKDEASAASAFDEASKLGLESSHKPFVLQTAFAALLAEWHAGQGNWRLAFTTCEACDAESRSALADWLLFRVSRSEEYQPARCDQRTELAAHVAAH